MSYFSLNITTDVLSFFFSWHGHTHIDSSVTDDLTSQHILGGGDNSVHMESTSPSMSSPLSSSEHSPQLSDREDVDDNEESSRQRCGWKHCDTEFDTLEDLIIHVRDDHIGCGKVRRLTRSLNKIKKNIFFDNVKNNLPPPLLPSLLAYVQLRMGRLLSQSKAIY